MEALRGSSVRNLKSKLPGVDPDLSAWAETPLVTSLGITLGVIESEKPRALEAVRQKTDLMMEFDFLYSQAYFILRGFLFLAGAGKAAQELPSLNRTRRGSDRQSNLLGRLIKGGSA